MPEFCSNQQECAMRRADFQARSGVSFTPEMKLMDGAAVPSNTLFIKGETPYRLTGGGIYVRNAGVCFMRWEMHFISNGFYPSRVTLEINGGHVLGESLSDGGNICGGAAFYARPEDRITLVNRSGKALRLQPVKIELAGAEWDVYGIAELRWY